MSANTGLSLARPAKTCSYCGRSFARSEHLSRHERSHRNERPYKCTLCNATFTRQDVFRRHHERYHTETLPPQQTQGTYNGEGSLFMHPRPSNESTMMLLEIESMAAIVQSPPFDLTASTSISTPTIDSLTSALGSTADFEAFMAGTLEDRTQGDVLNDMTLKCLTPPGSDQQASRPTSSREDESPTWKGSFTISEQQWYQLNSAVYAFGSVEQLNGFKLPSRLTLERLLGTFAECFLVYIPCIHTPTWKAELASPCIIFAMASIGASYYDDDVTATALHRIARTCIKKYVRRVKSFFKIMLPNSIKDRTQLAHHRRRAIMGTACLLLIMANGTKSGDFRTFQESASLASLLIEGIQYRKLSYYVPKLEDKNDDFLETWQKWIDFETKVRTICAIYIYLGALGVTFQTGICSWNMDIGDCFLPSDESEWTSVSLQAWLEIRKSNSRPPIRFSEAMRNILSQEGQPQVRLSVFGSYVTLHGIVRPMANLYQDSWLQDSLSTRVQRIKKSLARWRICSEQNPEFHCSPRYPSGVLEVNALSLYRQAHVRLCGNFRPFRTALPTRNLQAIISSLNEIKVNISSSSTCVKAAWCAIEALQMSIVMGLTQKGSISGWHSKLLFNNYSLECCLFQSFWVREQMIRDRSDRTTEENDILTATREALAEIDLDTLITSKPYSIQLIYAWSLLFKNSSAIGLYGVVADVLKSYADNLRD